MTAVKSAKPTSLAAIGCAAALFLAAVFYACVEVHSSTDTWIGLACGRQIAESPSFPINDSFSFTAAGHPSFNQNWLTHRIQYWLYASWGPDWVIYLNWAAVLVVHLLVSLATWWRTRSLFAALLAGAVVAFASRDYLSPRPATLGTVCMAATWAMLCAMGRTNRASPWWPMPILAAALLLWGQAHGSFTFGFGMVGLFLVQAIVNRILFRSPDSGVARLPNSHLVALAVVLIVGVTGAIVLSPFGIENLTHGEKIRASEIFRHVSEWYPPIGERAGIATFPPVWRFGVALAVGAALLILAGAGRLASQRSAVPKRTRQDVSEAPPDGRPVVSNLVFDLVILGLTITMGLWARRFAPVAFLFAGPIVATWIVALARKSDDFLVRIDRVVLATAALAAAGGLVASAISDINERLVEPYRTLPSATLLDRVTVTHQWPLESIDWLKRNNVACRLFCDWGISAMVMWECPLAKVFMDGRAQQTYEEDQFLAYVAIDLSPAATHEQILALLDGRAVGNVSTTRPTSDVVLVRHGTQSRLAEALDESVGKTWVLVFRSWLGSVYMRKDSTPFADLVDRVKRGDEWRPETADAIATRGEVYFNMTPPDRDRAVTCYKEAAGRDASYVAKTMPVIMRIEREAGRLPALLGYVDEQLRRFSAPVPGLSEKEAAVVRGQLSRWREMTVQAMKEPTPAEPADKTP